MKISGDALYYLLSRRHNKISHNFGRASLMDKFDLPMLYDETADMRGHTILIPAHVRPVNCPSLINVVFVCLDGELAKYLDSEGFRYVWVQDGTSFPGLFNRMVLDYVKHERLDAHLQAYVDTYSGFQPMFNALTDAFGCSCALVDKHFQRMYYSVGTDLLDKEGKPFSQLGMFEPEAIDLFTASNDYRRRRTSRRVFVVPGTNNLMMKNLFSGEELIGTLIVPHDGSMVTARFSRFVLDYFAPYVERMYDRLGSFEQRAVAKNALHSALLSALLGDSGDFRQVDRMLVEDGHAQDNSYALLFLERSFSHDIDVDLQYLVRRIEHSWRQSYALVTDDKLYVLASMGEAADEHAQALRADIPELLRDTMCKAGVSRLFGSVEHLSAARTQAHAALEQGKHDDPDYWYYRFDDYALSWLLSHGTGGEDPAHVCHPALPVLARYDEEHDTDLLRTLGVVMQCRYNASLAAERLYIARSTLLARLERIEAQTGVNLESLDERTYLGMSLALWGKTEP